jgi:hypothetical protein
MDEIAKKKQPVVNLKTLFMIDFSFYVPGILMIDLIYPRHSKILTWSLACLYLIYLSHQAFMLIAILGAIRQPEG